MDDTWLPSWISHANGRQKGVVLTDFGISTLVTNEAPAEGDDQWMIYVYIYKYYSNYIILYILEYTYIYTY